GCNSVTSVDGLTFVNPGAVLTVHPGAKIAGRKTSSSGDPSVLVVARDAKINAAGTVGNVILFTSDQAASLGGPGGSPADWGGVELLGRAPVNFPGGTGNAEGLPLGIGIFGGNEPNDSSGVIRYSKIEFSGITIS